MIKILLVDDEREEREGIAFLIEKYKYPMKVAYATNGKEALEYIYKNQVDILFTDVKMPVMSGLELAKLVNNYNPDIKIIIFSAYGEFEYAKQALEAKAVSYLLKPIELDEFQALMEQVIRTIDAEREEERSRREKDQYHFNNLLYKTFTMAKANDYEREQIQQYLFGTSGRANILIHVEFMDHYFDAHEEEFLQYARMYLGEDWNYIELYPSEGVLILRNPKLMLRKELTGQLRKLFRDIYSKERQDNQSMVIVSKKIHSLKELFEQQEKIRHIQEEAFGYHNKILWAGDDHDNIERYDTDMEVLKRELLEAVETLDAELIRKENEKLTAALESSDKISRLYMQNMLYTNIKALYDKVSPADSDEILRKAEGIFMTRELKGALREYRETMEGMLERIPGEKDETGIVQQIKTIVEQEYKRDISLDYIAERVNLSPAYVSYLFKKENGQTLVKYMTDKKMERARKLLENRSLKIVQVAKSCGYDNQSYFNKLFKNYFGVTPKQYRDTL